jgi:hypothetical protein
METDEKIVNRKIIEVIKEKKVILGMSVIVLVMIPVLALLFKHADAIINLYSH